MAERSCEVPSYDDGWRSIQQVAQELKISVDHAKVKIRQWKALNRVEIWRGVCQNESGRTVSTARYRAIPEFRG